MLMMKRRSKQSGVTLIELMIGMLLGLIVTGIAISMYISTLGITRQTNNTVRLGHELRASLDLITKDIRRAGYWNGSNIASSPHASVIDQDLPLMVFTASAPTAAVTDGDCVVLSYDFNRDGLTAVREILAYRLASSAIQSLYVASSSASSGVDCTITGDWNDVTDPSFVEITTLNFSLIPSGVASFAAASVRAIEIEIQGEVVSDDNIVRQLVEEVRIRNDI